MKSPFEYALDILQERQSQLNNELERVETELSAKQAELDSLNRYVQVLTNEKATLLDGIRGLDKAVEYLISAGKSGQSANQAK